jgi:hypothetical protein
MRSKFEERIKKYLEKIKVKYWYEPLRLPYQYTLTKFYTPDFIIYQGKLKKPRKPLTAENLRDTIVIEAKGFFKPSDRTKMILIKEQYPELDIRFLFQRDNKLNKKSKTTYSQWAESNGFGWAVGDEVPKDWIDGRTTKRAKNG